MGYLYESNNHQRLHLRFLPAAVGAGYLIVFFSQISYTVDTGCSPQPSIGRKEIRLWF